MATKKGLKNLNYEDVRFDKVTISHLTTRFDLESINTKPLYNLYDALLQETDISSFMKKYDIKFELNSGKIQVIFKGNAVNWENYLSSYKEPTVRMVINRLEGSSKSVADKCVNGFLFNDKIFKNQNVTHLIFGPEIVQNICDILLGSNIAPIYWQKNSKILSVIFKVDIKDIIFDEDSHLNNKQKIYYLYRHALYYLILKRKHVWRPGNSPIIRLKDKLNVPSKDIVAIETIVV